MAITATTLSAAAGIKDLTVIVASATGITAPNFTAGTGITYLLIDNEFMAVLSVSGTVIGVQRGYNGSIATAHVSGANVMIGLPADFPPQVELLTTSTTGTQTELGVIWPAVFLSGTADAVNPNIPGNYVVKTGSADAITIAAPAASGEGAVISIISDTAFAHTVTAPSALFAVGVMKTTLTFPAARGAGLIFRVCNGAFHVISDGAHGTNAITSVWT